MKTLKMQFIVLKKSKEMFMYKMNWYTFMLNVFGKNVFKDQISLLTSMDITILADC